MVKKTKSNRPLDNPFTQQKLPAWQPILSVHWVVLSFIVLFAIFTPIGIGLIFASKSVTEISSEYTNECTLPDFNSTYTHRQCKIEKLEFEVKEKIGAPVYMYYKLDNFYQNHRRYASSRSDKQLGGQKVSISDAKSSCSPIWAYAPEDSDVTDESLVYNPCGLIAWSMFNDTISLYKYNNTLKDSSTLICSGPRSIGSDNPIEGIQCTKVGIAWASDRDVKFKKPTGSDLGNRMYPNTYFNESGHVIPNHADEDFMVWMRTAALPNFRKLYRIINTDLTPGIYYFEIEYNYPVKDFGGKKTVILSNVSFLGGDNLFLAISYVSVGGICLVLAALFLLAWIAQFLFHKMKSKKATA